MSNQNNKAKWLETAVELVRGVALGAIISGVMIPFIHNIEPLGYQAKKTELDKVQPK